MPGDEHQGSPRLMGASIAGLRTLDAVAGAAFADRVILHAPRVLRAAAAGAVRASPFADRVEVQDEDEIRAALGPRDPVLVLHLGPNLLKAQMLRWATGNRSWPVCGYTYSVSPSGIFQSLALAAISGFQPYDSILCCSAGIREAVSRMLDAVSRRVPQLRKPRLPVVPLGMRSADFQPVPKADARRALGLPSEAVVFLYLGRIDPRYKANLQPLLTAFSRLKHEGDALLVVAGAQADASDETLGRLRFRSVELGIANRVRWHTNLTAEIRRQLLSGADVFVSPVDNLQESFGLAVVEAMCAGLPVIASDWNGYRDVVADRETGLLVPTLLPQDISDISARAGLADEHDFHWEVAEATVVDVPALARGMARLAGDPVLRLRMGEAGQKRARALFDWDSVLSRSREEWEAQIELARSSPEPPSPPLVLDHGEVFASHPSERLRGDAIVQRTPEALLASVVVSLPPPFLSRERLQEILEATAEATLLSRIPGDPVTSTRHAAYLLKHGLLEIVE